MEKSIIINSSSTCIKTRYYELACFMNGVTRKGDVTLLIKLSNLADSQGNFSLTARSRDLICEELNLNKPNLSMSIKRLSNLGIITGDKGDYQINPEIFINFNNEDLDKIDLKIELRKLTHY